MPMMPLLVAAVVFPIALALGLLLVRRRSTGEAADAEARTAGLAQLNGLHWRQFQRTVLAALQANGYRAAAGQDDGSDDDGLLLEHGERRVLLLTRQATGPVSPAVLQRLANELSLRGASRGLLATTGSFEPDTRTLARAHRIELLDGQTLWPLLQPAPASPQPPEAANARRNGVIVAWLGAAALAAIAWMVAQGLMPDEPPVAARSTATTPSVDTTSAADSLPQEDAVPTDPAALQLRRDQVVMAAATLPGIANATWSTQSTLLVHLAGDGQDPLPELCPLLLRYPELAASRVQLQPPPGSDAAVRFRQCRSY